MNNPSLFRAAVCSLGLAAVVMLFFSRLAAEADDSQTPRAEPISFDRDVRPLLAAKCLSCHGSGEGEAGLRFDSLAGATAPLDSGAHALVPGKPEESELLSRVADDDFPMPPKGERLTAKQIDILRRWIAAGAEWPEHWAYRPLLKPEPPAVAEGDAAWVRTPIDRFILKQLGERHLRPAPEADKRTLLRRLSFDLIGLPPTPEEMAAFLADDAPDAYEKQVERLLASPHYGERWARHWMDIVHYAETHGNDQDRPRPNAWPYRDYLIRAFNEDRPYARFVQEQLAGDVLYPDDPQAIVATGFLATGPWDESSLKDIQEDTLDRQIARYLDRDDIVTTALSTFASTTVHCARCHDHKFDPIAQTDYYALQAVFAGIDKAERPYDPDADVGRRRRELLAQKEAMPKLFATFHWMRQIDHELAQLPPQQMVYSGTNTFKADGGFKPTGAPRPIHLLQRGEITKPGPEVAPGALHCLEGLDGHFELAEPQNEGARRAALAAWMIDQRNVLAWRSIVNRVWQFHFDQAIVDTPNDFGKMGSFPSHPELLDWLAATFQENGGSFKRLHRLIVTSGVYRQSTRHNAEYAQRDAGNRQLWRMNRRRLDAESIRDAVLLASGQLDRTLGGPSVKQFIESPGIHVTPMVDYQTFSVDDPANRRRSVYRFIFRTIPDPFMDALDCPDSSQLTPQRNSSVTALQALALWNDKFILRFCEHIAARAKAETEDRTEQIGLLYEWLLCRPPSEKERAALGEYIDEAGLANACRVLVNSNEFLFVN